MDFLSANVTPFIRGPADVINFVGRNAVKTRECGDLEMDALECMESYGAYRGRKICQDYVDDYRECVKSCIQTQRVSEMKIERTKQLMRGERRIDEFYDSIRPPKDAYQPGPFYN